MLLIYNLVTNQGTGNSGFIRCFTVSEQTYMAFMAGKKRAFIFYILRA